MNFNKIVILGRAKDLISGVQSQNYRFFPYTGRFLVSSTLKEMCHPEKTAILRSAQDDNG
jgi:hypothetical protein